MSPINQHLEKFEVPNHLDTILEDIDDPILVIDAKGCLQWVNQAGRHLLKIHLTIGQTLPPDKGYDDLVRLSWRTNLFNTLKQMEIALPDGRTYWAGSTLIQGNSQVIILHDVTYIKELDRAKNEIVLTAVHDMTNPLTALLIATDTLLTRDSLLDEGQTSALKSLQSATRQMSRKIESLIESASEVFDDTMRWESCDMRFLLTYVFQAYQPLADDKHQTLTCLPTQENVQVMGDAMRLYQALHNLLGYVIKFTSLGAHIMVKAEIDKHFVWVHFYHTGTGKLISNWSNILTPPHNLAGDMQILEEDMRKLSMAKSIVEQHGGQSISDNEFKRNIRFSFRLPLAIDPF